MLFIFSCILLHLTSLTIAQTDLVDQNCSNDVGNYTTNSNFQRNLNSVLSSLDSNTQIDYGFYNLSVGQPGPDQANVIALCRGDIGVDECQNCIRNSSGKILQVCPNQKEAFGIADTCFLRYSNKSIFGVMEDDPVSILVNTGNATDVNQFNQALQTLMSGLRSTAASGNSLRKFATGNETAGFDTIFGLVQCTPDLSEPQCDDCIAGAIRVIATCCDGRQGARITSPSCNLRYEVYRFFGVTPATPQLPASPSPQAPSVPPPPPPAEGMPWNVLNFRGFHSICCLITQLWISLSLRFLVPVYQLRRTRNLSFYDWDFSKNMNLYLKIIIFSFPFYVPCWISCHFFGMNRKIRINDVTQIIHPLLSLRV